MSARRIVSVELYGTVGTREHVELSVELFGLRGDGSRGDLRRARLGAERYANAYLNGHGRELELEGVRAVVTEAHVVEYALSTRGVLRPDAVIGPAS